jgi:DNA-binding NarL/FixJ family response regulator
MSRLQSRAAHHIAIMDNTEPHIAHLTSSLSAAGYLCTTFARPYDFICSLRSCDCDLVVADLIMPEMDGMRFLTEVRRHRPDVPVVFVSGRASTSTAVKAMHLGAADFIDRNATDAHAIVSRIAAVLSKADVADERMPDILTLMEKVVLKHVLMGMGNREIAQRLGLSVRTIEDHRSNMMRKLQVSNVVELVKRCVDIGIVHVTEPARSDTAAAQPPLDA